MTIRLALFFIHFFTLLSSSTVYALAAASTWPAPIPLFHKSPYFNAWIDASSNVSNSPVPRWPHFLNLTRAIAWFTAIRVDNTSYVIQGYRDQFSLNYTLATTVSIDITATQTRFSIAAGPVLVNLTYLTPIELQDWTLHSFPFAYTAFDIISSDGSPHAIQLYTDATAQYVSSLETSMVTWNTSFTAKSIYHMVQRRPLQTLTENVDMSEDGSLIWAYTATPDVSMTWQTSSAGISRGNFSLLGKLENTSDTNFRIIGSQWPVLAYALDLGSITKTSNTLVVGFGLIRDPVVSYRTVKTTQSLSHLWYSRWNDVGSAIDNFLTSYSSASLRANALDDLIQLNASSLASQYHMSTSTATMLVDLHILSLRQTIGSLEFTTMRPSTRVDMNDVRIFMKDVGYSRRTNPVEILYASFSAFLFLNTTLAGKLLEPLLEFQDSSLYRNEYAAPDLGNTWPIIQGNTTDQSLLAIDSCGAMLIMALTHARKSGDGTMLYNYYGLLRKWADYLVKSMKQPGSYMSSDGLYSSNANLALKGIMGLYAMGKINGILEERGADVSKTSYYLGMAKAYAQDWLNEAVSSDHVMASYGSNSTWAMIYNLFAPRLLGATIIPEQIYEIQASWYASRSGSAATFGLPYDGTQSLAKAHWTLLSASSVSNTTSSVSRDALIRMVHSRSFSKSGLGPNPATYSPVDGKLSTGFASPAMGAVYSLLALNLPDLTISLPSGSLGNPRSTTNVPVIVGATFGSLGLVLLVTGGFFLHRRRKSKLVRSDGPVEELRTGSQGLSDITPFTDSLVPTGVENAQNGNIPISRNLNAEKFSTIRSPESIHRTATPTDDNALGPVVNGSRDGRRSPGDDNLRWEVEQLRRVVETLSTQQVQQQPQVVYQQAHGSLPDEPPPVYPY